jgi:hypothetical protein
VIKLLSELDLNRASGEGMFPAKERLAIAGERRVVVFPAVNAPVDLDKRALNRASGEGMLPAPDKSAITGEKGFSRGSISFK